MNEEQMQRDFEEAHRHEDLSKDGIYYARHHTRILWLGWQAAAEKYEAQWLPAESAPQKTLIVILTKDGAIRVATRQDDTFFCEMIVVDISAVAAWTSLP